MDMKSWEDVEYLRLELESAIAQHNAALSKLYRNGDRNAPIYAPEIMREHGTKARQTLTAKLDQLAGKVGAIKERAKATTAAALDDPYSWLDDADLQRAALLKPFIAEDVAAIGLAGMAQLSMEVKTGKRTFPRPAAWLLMREAEKLGAPTETFMRLALPEDAARAEAEAHEAHVLGEKIARARPEFRESAMQMVQKFNYDATGELIAA